MIPAIRCRSAESDCTNWKRSAKKMESTFSSTLVFSGSKRMRITNEATMRVEEEEPGRPGPAHEDAVNQRQHHPDARQHHNLPQQLVQIQQPVPLDGLGEEVQIDGHRHVRERRRRPAREAGSAARQRSTRRRARRRPRGRTGAPARCARPPGASGRRGRLTAAVSWTKTAPEAATRAAGTIANGESATATVASAVAVANRRRPSTRPADSP